MPTPFSLVDLFSSYPKTQLITHLGADVNPKMTSMTVLLSLYIGGFNQGVRVAGGAVGTATKAAMGVIRAQVDRWQIVCGSVGVPLDIVFNFERPTLQS